MLRVVFGAVNAVRVVFLCLFDFVRVYVSVCLFLSFAFVVYVSFVLFLVFVFCRFNILLVV